ncbi:mannose-6-phosphate isomerase, class I [uncultured Jatrophihabitans sp.]|uniref:mannose-6-phosphate isomerase, class I n=1 Tax=uncultured Jatrophihabitans sp. TaxID=1610747 RepID=UPI0035CAF110
MTVALLDGVARRYDWGSTSAIQQLLGVPPDGRPIAELWFGAHPDDPSGLALDGRTLDALIADDPRAALGDEVAAEFDGRLPYLVKILAAEKALSIQVHPSLPQARAGFAREDAAGVARDAAWRNYRDANHKPELICALSRFEALCGFRAPERSAALLDELAVPELSFLVDLLRGPDSLRAAFTGLLEHQDPAALAAAVAERGDVVEAAAHPPVDDADVRAGALRAAGLAAHDLPGDIGVVLALLLNYVALEPGEAIFLGAGNVHAYLRGVGVEIMANSDNVLRCGLTAKHIDVPEVLAVADFAELDDPRVAAVGGAYPTPARDFLLSTLDLETGEPMALHDSGPCVVLCGSGQITVDRLALASGRAAFVSADTRVTLAGNGKAFIAAVG